MVIVTLQITNAMENTPHFSHQLKEPRNHLQLKILNFANGELFLDGFTQNYRRKCMRLTNNTRPIFGLNI